MARQTYTRPYPPEIATLAHSTDGPSVSVSVLEDDGRVVIEAPVQRGFYFETIVKIERVGKADVRKYVIPHASPSLSPAIVREFYHTNVEWGLDCL